MIRSHLLLTTTCLFILAVLGLGHAQDEDSASPTSTDPFASPVPTPKEQPTKDERSEATKNYSAAMEYAISTGDVNVVEALLDGGFDIDSPLELQRRFSPLHYAILAEQPDVVEVLVTKGANLLLRNKWDQRPIDSALALEQWKICDHLRLPEAKEELVDGLPLAMIQAFFWRLQEFFAEEDRKQIWFVRLAEQDPSPQFLREMRAYFPNSKEGSRMREIQALGKTKARFEDKETKESGSLLEIFVKKREDGNLDWTFGVRSHPLDLGSGTGGTAEERYGYWIVEQTGSWDA